jgi:hypothetical protein
MQSLNVTDFLKSRLIYINRGILLYAVPTKRNQITNGYNIFVGGVYENGNSSCSCLHLNTIGPLNGNLMIQDNPINIESILYNYLHALIPGQYPPISGPELYDLNELQNLTEQPNVFFCKILGLGNGVCHSFQVANVSQNGVSTLAQNLTSFNSVTEELTTLYLRKTTNAKTISYSNILPEFTLFSTETGVSDYLKNIDWDTQFGISSFNGSNTFPTFGWAGARVGSITPQTFQSQQDSFFNFPTSLLNVQPNFPIGIIYAGQGVQYSSFPSFNSNRVSNKSLSNRNRIRRVFQEKVNNRQNANVFQLIRVTGIQPYQQGRGIYDYVSREPQYDSLGNITIIDLISTIAPEGSVPGRNNAFAGVAITDYWSPDLNLNNQGQSSRTPKDTRKTTPLQRQSKTAHNAPMVYLSEDSNNTYNPLPWNNLMSYVGTTSQSASNRFSENTPVLSRGITTMIVSGAYPLYRGSNSTEFSGATTRPIFTTPRYYASYQSQYYITEQFWNPNFSNPNLTPEIRAASAVAPNPPYIIKGGRIVLYEGQRVNAGSYVYANMHMTGNVSMSKFFGASAKEIVLNQGADNFLLQNLYSKYQSNQGGLIVLVTQDDSPVPLIPSCCQPIGIILEDIIGEGRPIVQDEQILVEPQTLLSTDLQTVPESFETTKQLQNQEVLIQLFPMFANQSLSGFYSTELMDFFFLINPASSFASNYAYASPVASKYMTPIFEFVLPDKTNVQSPAAPTYRKIRTSYVLQDGKYAFNTSIQQGGFNVEQYVPYANSFKDRQQSMDWPVPQGVVATVDFNILGP